MTWNMFRTWFWPDISASHQRVHLTMCDNSSVIMAKMHLILLATVGSVLSAKLRRDHCAICKMETLTRWWKHAISMYNVIPSSHFFFLARQMRWMFAVLDACEEFHQWHNIKFCMGNWETYTIWKVLELRLRASDEEEMIQMCSLGMHTPLEFLIRYAHLRLQLCTFLLAELFVMSAPQITDPAAPLNIRSNSVRHIFPKLATSSSKARNNSSINTLLLHSVSKMETEKDNNSKSHEISVIHTWQWQRKEKFLKLDTVCSVLCMFTYT